MRHVFLLSILLGLACAVETTSPTPDAGPPPNPLMVTTTQGDVEGLEEEGLRVFRGIPYAAAPVSDRRFRPTRDHAGWADTLEAKAFGPRCPQPKEPTDGWATDEDCLTLNIWAHPAGDEKRPVMVWIHGGSFVSGAGSAPIYQGDHIAADGDVVVVTLNYRLGLLGFLATAGLRAEGQGVAGNYALYDQAHALRWVQNNIAAFGGDPARVTIFGESAGSMSICALLGSPLASDLFERAVLQSGTCWRVVPLASEDDTENGLDRGRAALAALGCNGGADELTCLRGKTVDEILTAQTSEGMSLGMVIEGEGGLIVTDPVEAFEAGRTPDRAILIGTNKHEWSFWEVGNTYTPEQYQAWIRGWVTTYFTNADFAEHVITTLLEMYPATNDVEAWWARVAMNTDIWFTCPSLAYAKIAAGGTQPAYAYHFDHAPENSALAGMGASHSFELSFLFGTADQMGRWTYTPSVNDLRVGDDMRSAWTDFAHGYPPAPPEEWPSYNPANPRFGEFASGATTLVDQINDGRCDRLRSLYLAR
jgi:para-nitrobenzyl esterase